MSYEDALSTQLLATHCGMCGRPLRDPQSIERGIGPDCYERALMFDARGPGPLNEELFVAALKQAPQMLQERLLKISGPIEQGTWKNFGVRRDMVSVALHHAALATSFGSDGTQTNRQGYDTAKAVIATTHALALAGGFNATAERINANFRLDRAKGTIDIKITYESVDKKTFGLSVPYNEAFNTAARARKDVFTRFQKRGGEFIRFFKSSDLLKVINIIQGVFGDTFVLGPDGNIIALPTLRIQEEERLAAETPPSPKTATNEEAKAPAQEVKKGDYVLHKGIKMRVGWVGKNRDGGVTVGLGERPPYIFVSAGEVKLESPAEQVRQIEIVRKQEAVDQETSVQEVPKPQRAVPERLFPHQKEGVIWLDKMHSGLLAYEQGLGKTAAAIVALDSPAVAVVPATIKVNWLRETGMWRPRLSTYIVSGTKRPTQIPKVDLYIINYDILKYHVEWLKEIKPQTLIADESQYLKNLEMRWNKEKKLLEPGKGSPQRATAFWDLWTSSNRIFLLTGTPIMNRVKELWPQLFFIDPNTWGNWFKFCERYCAGHWEEIMVRGGRMQRVWDCNGRSNSDELHQRINDVFMMRRTKDIIDLPEKMRTTLHVSMSETIAQQYKKAAEKFKAWLEEKFADEPERVGRALSAEALTKINELRQLVAKGKLEATLELIQEHLESTNRPLVVMAHHREVLEGIAQGLDIINGAIRTDIENDKAPEVRREIRYGMVYGGMAAGQKQQAIDAFQAGDLDVMLFSIDLAVGVTLTRASEMYFVERMWRPADLVQAEDRIHRIGAKNKVTITYLDCPGTIDEVFATMLATKTSAAFGVIDGKDLTQEEALSVVIGQLLGKRELRRNPEGDEVSWDDPL